MNTEMWAELEKFILWKGEGGEKKKLGRGCWEQSEPLGSFGCKCTQEGKP